MLGLGLGLGRTHVLNKEVAIFNLHEDAFAARRLICDQPCECSGGIFNTDLNNKTTASVRCRCTLAGARLEYMFSLEDEKKKKKAQQAGLKKKPLMKTQND